MSLEQSHTSVHLQYRREETTPASLEMTFEMKKRVREEEGSSTRTVQQQSEFITVNVKNLTTTTTKKQEGKFGKL